jgi:NAD(P)H-hydrate epimerase
MNNGIPSIILMENAAKNVTDEIIKMNFENILIFAGKGNNGGDGLAVARQLITAGKTVKIIFIGDKNKATTDCKINLSALENFNADILYLTDNIDNTAILSELDNCDIIVDSMIGTGLNRAVGGVYADITDMINQSKKYVIAVDCPTGINSENGEDYGKAVFADKTITFHYPKKGMLLYPAFGHMGEIKIGNIGMPYGNEPYSAFVLTKSQAQALLPKRTENSHKGTYGTAVFVSGCDKMTGAAVFNVKAAYKTGCGLVKIASVKHCIDVVQLAAPEAVTMSVEEENGFVKKISPTVFKNIKAFAIGSGLGNVPNNADIIRFALEECAKNKITPVVDADALNTIAFKKDYEILNGAVITPHLKEMSRLTDKSIAEIQTDLIGTAAEFSAKYNVVTVLKSAHTIIASPNGRICINTTGCSAMSKGGTGDCLAGIITSLIAQGLDGFSAAISGAYICGLAGEKAAKKYGNYSVNATDIIESIPKAIKKLSKQYKITL